MDPRELDQKDDPELWSLTSPSNEHLQPSPSLPILGIASCKTTSTIFHLLPYLHLILMALGLHTGREEPQGLQAIHQISPVYIHTSRALPRQTPTSRNMLQMAKPRDLKRILLSLIRLSAPPELRLLLPCQSSCHIITGRPKPGTERWTVSTGEYMGRVVLPTGSCISPVGAKSCNRGVTLHQKGPEELTITGWSSSDSECGFVA